MVVVESDGGVLWIPPAIYMSSCGIDITNFPFDIQECHMKFGSWTYDGLKLDIDFYDGKPEIDISDYVPSNEWNLIAHPALYRQETPCISVEGYCTPCLQRRHPAHKWNLIGHPAQRHVQYYAGLTAPYVDLRFHIMLQRVAIFYKYILVLPCVLLSFLTLVIFWLPPESAAKMMLGA